MIGNFHYASAPQSAAVNVEMAWRDSARMGWLVVEPALHAALARRDYPALDTDAMGLDSALAYALFIALRAGIPLFLTGDRSVWVPQWGQLLSAPVSGPLKAVRGGGAPH